MAFLDADDRYISADGGPSQLAPEELKTACVGRGIDVAARSDTHFQGVLSDWLRLTAAENVKERWQRMSPPLFTRYVLCPVSEAFREAGI